MMLKALIARFEDTRDLRLMGGYRKGTDAELDRAIDLVPKIYEAMRQGPEEAFSDNALQDLVRALTPESAAPAPPAPVAVAGPRELALAAPPGPIRSPASRSSSGR
jgi:flagellum-specific ATP synthase